jgi:hypothetical protein
VLRAYSGRNNLRNSAERFSASSLPS